MRNLLVFQSMLKWTWRLQWTYEVLEQIPHAE